MAKPPENGVRMVVFLTKFDFNYSSLHTYMQNCDSDKAHERTALRLLDTYFGRYVSFFNVHTLLESMMYCKVLGTNVVLLIVC